MITMVSNPGAELDAMMIGEEDFQEEEKNH